MITSELCVLSTFIPKSHPYLSEITLLLHELDKLQKEEGGKPRLRILELDKGTQVTHFRDNDAKVVEQFMLRWDLYPTRLGISFMITRPEFKTYKTIYPNSLYDWYVKNLTKFLAENKPRKLAKEVPSPVFQRYGFGNEKSEEYLELVGPAKHAHIPGQDTYVSGNAFVRYDLARQAWQLYKQHGTIITLQAMLNTLFGPNAFDEPNLTGTYELRRDRTDQTEEDTPERFKMWLSERVAPRLAKLLIKEGLPGWPKNYYREIDKYMAYLKEATADRMELKTGGPY